MYVQLKSFLDPYCDQAGPAKNRAYLQITFDIIFTFILIKFSYHTFINSVGGCHWINNLPGNQQTALQLINVRTQYCKSTRKQMIMKFTKLIHHKQLEIKKASFFQACICADTLSFAHPVISLHTVFIKWIIWPYANTLTYYIVCTSLTFLVCSDFWLLRFIISMKMLILWFLSDYVS